VRRRVRAACQSGEAGDAPYPKGHEGVPGKCLAAELILLCTGKRSGRTREGHGGYAGRSVVSQGTGGVYVERELSDLVYIRSRSSTAGQENKAMSTELSSLRITSSRLESDSKDAAIALDSTREKVAELQKDMEEQNARIEELKRRESREKEEEKEKRKQEMLSEMMSKIDMVSSRLRYAAQC
jgi:hypothetical protein